MKNTSIWRVPKYLPYVQASLTAEIIENAEKRLGYKLPEEYLDLLKIQNGGYIRFTLPNTVHRQIYGIGPNYPSILFFEYLRDYDDLSFDTTDLFPFDGDGHWNICLDYRRNKIEPEITYVDTESDFEKPIARNFKDYLNLLELETENEYAILTNSNIEEAIKQISTILSIKFEEPDFLDYGYAVYRSSFKESWIWLSPNLVPGGFVREEDELYNDLKSQMDTMALRYPEVPENALLISVSEEREQQELFDLLTNNGFQIREIVISD
jgi:hypothetical protein